MLHDCHPHPRKLSRTAERPLQPRKTGIRRIYTKNHGNDQPFKNINNQRNRTNLTMEKSNNPNDFSHQQCYAQYSVHLQQR